ncbi:SurA N-terminal domain-containing protein [Noviherbaspirillum sp. Root189]|uniref:SurA N-terminal domain-containing protein n=1 Tax=Noviherbaspirillum sp. Root189 TaxID=1736487 RepID=UPI00071008FE|nr:SurA N-terminal domain-containing protein [Noviherbaspirillum sp. Root189]KRB93362.1 peptidylprolyl isomerase [Noviherbaspirillum sp. Root189]
MFEFIRTHRRLMQFALLLFIFPSFAFFGLEGYTRFREGGNAIAKVAGQTITQQEFDNAQREQMERLRQMFGGQFDPKLLDTPEAKQNILDGLIAQRVIAAEAAKNNLAVSDQALQQNILAIPGLIGADGKFDVERYKSLLAAQGMTPAMYEARLRQDLSLQQVSSGVQGTAFAPKTVANRLSDLNDQQREVQEILFKASDFVSQVKVTDEMLKAYYEKNAKQFEIPEQVKAEYVVLNNDVVASQITVSDADIKSYYDQNASRYGEEEQRRASHILIKADKSASAADKAAAKEKAEKLLAQVRKNPADFAKVAKENSQDPGSAERGGDLDFFGKGMMVKPFEDAAFKLKQGEISDVVESDFGYHIIQLMAVKPATAKTLDEVKEQIAADIKKQLAAKKFAELAEQFNNTVYEQADSLKPVADKLKLKIETVSGLTRTPNPATAPTAPYNNPKFLAALFSDEAIKNKRNTEAVEVAPNTLIAGHVIEYKPVTRRPFEEVQAAVRERVVQEEAAALAKKAGESKLAKLKSGDDAAGFGETKVVSRTKAQGITPAAIPVVMKTDTTKLPAFAGVDLGAQGYGVYRITKVSQPATTDTARRQGEQQQIGNALAQQEALAYLEALKKKSKVEILKPVGTTPAEGVETK